MVLHEAGIHLLGPELTAIQSETTAATVKDYYLPFGFMVLEWGVFIVEDFVAHDVDLVVALQVLDKAGGTVTTVSSLSLSGGNTSILAGNGTKEAQTAITAETDLDNGDVVYGPRSVLPYKASTSQILRLAVTTATGSAGGAIIPFAIVKPLIDARAATSWIDTD
jgi:hypothetical protein